MRSSSFFPRIEGVEASSRRESAKRGAKSEGLRWRMWVQHEKNMLYNIYVYRHTVDTTRQQHIAYYFFNVYLCHANCFKLHV